MKNKFSLIAIVGVITVALLVGVMATSYSQVHDKTPNLPILDYEAEMRKTYSEEQRRKSSRIEVIGSPMGNEPIVEPPAGVEILPENNHWWIGLDALPIAQSNVIVLGKVTSAKAYLSSDKTGVYSEFSIEVEKVFKDTTKSIHSGSILSANRPGGAVRFTSGKTLEYRFYQQAMPRKDGRYMLFLSQSENGDLMIITGYELSNGIVTPLDGVESKDARANLVFSTYRNASESQFLKDLNIAVKSILPRKEVR